MTCQRLFTTQAYLDHQLDVDAAFAAKEHAETCRACTALSAQTLALRRALRLEATHHRAPEALRRTILRKINDLENVSRASFSLPPAAAWKKHVVPSAASWALGAALAASFVIFAWNASAPDQLARDIVSAHLRSLVGSHLVEVRSSEDRKVNPWFAAQFKMPLPVEDFESAGYRLLGGRADYVDGRRAVVAVYRSGEHVVNVFVWRDEARLKSGAHALGGYNLLSWRRHDLFFCAVSDADRNTLERLSELLGKPDFLD